MCLNTDGQKFCSVLRSAPHYNGKSLERVEHDLEENDEAYTKELEMLLAKTCGLSTEDYRSRLTRIRGENLIKEIRCSGYDSKHGPCGYFLLPPGTKDYVLGRTHEPPRVELITSEAQEALKKLFDIKRRTVFHHRLSRMSPSEIRAFPEWREWLCSLLERAHLDKTSRRKERRRRIAAQMLGTEAPVDFQQEVISEIAVDHEQWFLDRHRFDLPPFILLLLEADDATTARALHTERRMIHASRPRKGRGGTSAKTAWQTKKSVSNGNFRAWKRSVAGKYVPRIPTLLLEEFKKRSIS